MIYSTFYIPCCSILFYSIYNSIFALIHFTLLCIISLLCFMLCFPHSAFLQPSCLLCSGSLHLFALYTPYFTILCYIFTPLYFRLLCIASFLYITSLRFTSFCTIALCFPYFSWSSFRSDFNFTSSWDVGASFYSLHNLLRWASRHSTSPYSALLRLAWTRGFGEIRAGLTVLCNLLAVQERNGARAALLILRNAF